MDIFKNLKEEYKKQFMKFGVKQPTSMFARANWIKNNLPSHLRENKNALLMGYWIVFDSIKNSEDACNAEQVETILRSQRN